MPAVLARLGITAALGLLPRAKRAAVMASTSASSSARPRLFILGATGATGRALVDQALERGHRWTAFVRSPQKLGGPRAALTVVQGDPRSVDALRAALPGHDAVLSMLGPPGAGTNDHRRRLRPQHGDRHGDAGVSRLLIVGVGALFAQGPLTALIRGTFLRNVAKDAAEMERVVTTSGLDWTIVRVPRLTNGPAHGRYPRGRTRAHAARQPDRPPWPRSAAPTPRASCYPRSSIARTCVGSLASPR